ncbi:hypothetical protein CCACVL1_13790 [Corchorus capsularis]|uniref:RNase H type-1 domain-containing protein n=1 Tax=Corchorus capsularis TaxID=210143 RepID=A0A1R3I9Q2_COCAP|nr:hypothetical protein CCACVL1_13790 [Corchorus capsularis]
MSLFPLPATVKAELDKIQRRFLCGGSNDLKKIHWINWNQVCKPKEIGGLDIVDLDLNNRGLLKKWVWRFGNERNSLWRMCNLILLLYISYGMTIIVGDGKNIKFWSDHWIGDSPLKLIFPRIFSLAVDKDARIADLRVRMARFGDGRLGCGGTFSTGRLINGIIFKLALRTLLLIRIFLTKSSGCLIAAGTFRFLPSANLAFSCWEVWSFFCKQWGVSWSAPSDAASFTRSWLKPAFYVPVIEFWKMLFFAIICLFGCIETRCPKNISSLLGDSGVRCKRAFSTWVKPPPGYLKFNVDASVRGKPGPGGIGGILRDHEGKYIVEFSKSV